MKHLHYLAVVAVGSLMLASCSNDEVVSSPTTPQKAIDFKAMANKSTRADVTTNNIEVFHVFGCNMDATTTNNHVMSFDDVIVHKDDAGWTYDNIQYWAPNKDYFFVAISTNNTNPAWTFENPTSHDTSLSAENFKGYGSVTMDITKQIEGDDDVCADRDLVYAYATRTTDATITNSSAVDFTFYHMLSRLGFSFKNTFENSAYSFRISNVKISNLINTATCELGVEPTALVWTPAEGIAKASDIMVTMTNTIANQGGAVSTVTGNYKYIIPGDAQEIKISFDVTVLLGGNVYSKRTLKGSIPATDYQPGKSYMLTAEINQDNIIEGGAKPIEFGVSTVTGWGTNNPGSIELDNDNTGE